MELLINISDSAVTLPVPFNIHSLCNLKTFPILPSPTMREDFTFTLCEHCLNTF